MLVRKHTETLYDCVCTVIMRQRIPSIKNTDIKHCDANKKNVDLCFALGVKNGAVTNERYRPDFEEIIILQDVPCRLCAASGLFSADKNATDTGLAVRVRQRAMLMLAPETEIPAGCMVEVSGREGLFNKARFHRTGIARKYMSHQEIELESAQEWA